MAAYEQLTWWSPAPLLTRQPSADPQVVPSESASIWTWYRGEVDDATTLVGTPDDPYAPPDEDEAPGAPARPIQSTLTPLGHHRYGLLQDPVVVRLDEVRRAIRAYADGGAIPEGPLTAPACSAVFLSCYVGDPSEIGPRGGIREPAFKVAMDNDRLNQWVGIPPEDLWSLAFPTRRNQLYFITSTIRYREWPRVYRYDTADRIITGARLHINRHDDARIYQQRGGHLAAEWLRRCARRRSHGDRADYQASECPSIFANCLDRFHIEVAGRRLGRWPLLVEQGGVGCDAPASPMERHPEQGALCLSGS